MAGHPDPAQSDGVQAELTSAGRPIRSSPTEWTRATRGPMLVREPRDEARTPTPGEAETGRGGERACGDRARRGPREAEAAMSGYKDQDIDSGDVPQGNQQ